MSPRHGSPAFQPPSSAPLALRLARFNLVHADDPKGALTAVRFALKVEGSLPGAGELLFQVLEHARACDRTRRDAADLLLAYCDRTGRLEEALGALDAAIALHVGERRWALRWDLANRLTLLGRRADALLQLGALLLEAPSDAAGRSRLWQVASQAGLAGLQQNASAGGRTPKPLPTAADQLTRLADLLCVEMGSPRDALPHYVEAIQLAPQHAGARAGLRGLLDRPSLSAEAGEALARAYRLQGQRELLADLLPVRLANAPDVRTRVALLTEPASVHEVQLAAPGAAFALLVQAFVEAPEAPGLEHRMRALAERAGQRAQLPSAYAAAAGSVADRPALAARLYALSARGLECTGASAERCLAAYEAAWDCLLEVEPRTEEAGSSPSHRNVLRGLVRQAARGGVFRRAVQALTDLAARSLRPDVGAFAYLEAQARASGCLSELGARLDRALVDAGSGLPQQTAHYLDLQLARLLESACGDCEGAERVLLRAIERAPAATDARMRIVALHRRMGSPRLLASLLALDENDAAVGAEDDRRDLDALFEAATLAVEVGDPDSARCVLARLYEQATSLCALGRDSLGRHTATACIEHATALAHNLPRKPLSSRPEATGRGRVCVSGVMPAHRPGSSGSSLTKKVVPPLG